MSCFEATSPLSVVDENKLTVMSPLGSFAGLPEASWSCTWRALYDLSSLGSDAGTAKTANLEGMFPTVVSVS